MNERLLIVEDSPTQADRLRADLEAAGYRVSVAREGEEALRLLREQAPSLVVSDIVMPGMDGFELCRAIKSDPDLDDFPVILLTSLRDPLDIIRGLEVGADNFLTKPYQTEHLHLRIQTMLTSRQLRADGRMQMGVELSFMGRRFSVNAERQQILDLLVSTFEDLVHTNTRLLEREQELADARDVLADQLEKTEEERLRLRSVLTAIPDAVFIVNRQGTVTDVNPAAGALLQRETDELVGLSVQSLVTVTDDEGRTIATEDWPIVQAFNQGIRTVGSPEFQIAYDGQRIPISITAAPIGDPAGNIVAAVGVVRDLSLAALTDPLTGLSNRSLFGDRLARAVASSDRHGTLVAVLRLSLDRFTLIHDTLGREAENGLLVAVSGRLRHCLRDEATVARLGGDDFAVLLEDVTDAAETVRVADRIMGVLRPSFTLGKQEVFLTTSMGIALTGTLDQTADDLLHHANVALHRAVEQGGDRHELFDEDLSAAALRRLQLETDLRRGVERGELVVFYQPVIELTSGRVVECEALVRWQHPTRGLVPPNDFIPLAEQTGLIVDAGMDVLNQACRQTRAWQEELGTPLGIAVNLSARQFEDPDLVAGVTAALRDSDLDAASLTLEITETAVIRNPDAALATLHSLRAAGVRLAIDDFGTGYSSLSYLKSFPVDVLKIDRSFILRLDEDGQDAAIVQAVLTLAQSLGMAVTAEGVETEQQLAWLGQSQTCDLAAGYLFSRPLPAAEVAPLLALPFAGYSPS